MPMCCSAVAAMTSCRSYCTGCACAIRAVHTLVATVGCSWGKWCRASECGRLQLG